MKLQRLRIGKLFSVITVAVLLSFVINGAVMGGAIALAETCSPSVSNGNGVTRPTGSAAHTYHYDCTSGLWENDHYTYNPLTRQTSPKDPVVYIYNSSTGLWDVDAWVFNAPSGNYVKRTSSVLQPPVGATKVGGPPPAVADSSSAAGGSGADGSSATAGSVMSMAKSGQGGGAGQGTASTSAQATHNVSAMAVSGEANVVANTTAGNAQTGAATALTFVVNSLQSNTVLCEDSETIFFVTDIDGDVNGDILIDPSAIKASASSVSGLENIAFNSSTDVEMNNSIEVSATSGDASVSRNTAAGSATSGNATAIANIINLINAAITAGSSFTGVININGNLNGDILLPSGFIDQLLASNVPTIEVDPADLAEHNSMAAAIMTDQEVRNNVTVSAVSGDASVSRNTTAGSAVTGAGESNITIFNLTGSSVIASNSLLVFVNNMGQWVGLLVDAPENASAVQYGGGVASSSALPTPSVDTTASTSNRINNEITVKAQTGNSTVDSNTYAGNAVSGDAKAAVNILNVMNSSFSLSGWLGILFINVFGSWNGSFGINTSAGDPVLPVPSQPITETQAINQVFSFAPRDPHLPRSSNSTVVVLEAADDRVSSQHTISKTDELVEDDRRVEAALTAIPDDSSGGYGSVTSGIDWGGLLPVALLSLLAGLAMAGVDRVNGWRKKRLIRNQPLSLS